MERSPRERAPVSSTAARIALGGIVLVWLALFALAGASCARDHDGRVAVGQRDCATCHLPEYETTTSPPHPGLFPTSCGACHTETAWVPAQAIEHDWFVIANAHVGVQCTACHTTGFAPGDTPRECVGCHLADYEGTTMPPHAGGGISTDCASCHTDAGWRPSTFTHPWPLDGAHLRATCGACHGEPPTYRGTPTQCVDCHRADYDSSPHPGHSTFPTTCADCHTTSGWTPALGGAHPEGRFPITSGPHSRFGCLDCHDPSLGSSTGGMNTDCVGCHTGEHANEDSGHREVRGYPTGPDRSPHFCLDCHPNGRD